jgi:membrane-associated phospholipid phosphatase
MRTATRLLAALAVTVTAVTWNGPATSAAPAQAASTRDSGAVVVEWNRALLRIVRTPGAQPPTVHPTRSFAILHAAIYDAAVSASGHGRGYLFTIRAPRGASARAAAAQAGHDTLAALYPSFAGTLDQQLAGELATIPDGRSKSDGVRVGQLSARFLLAARADDGSAATPPPFTPGTTPSDYRPTPPAFAPAVFTGWSAVTPFLVPRAEAFRPGPPPPLTSTAYAAALNEVQSLGQDVSTTRTAEQTVVARFWAAPIWNYWNEIAQSLVTSRRAGLVEAARVFAQLDLSIADSVIAFYDAKYHYAFWRPVTAIQLAGTDGNPLTVGNEQWNPLATTPADPSYPGAHSAVSATAATVLAAFFGDRAALSVVSEALPGTIRTFDRLSDVVTEAGLSRIYAGVHTGLDHVAGVRLGRELAQFTLRHGLN